MKFSVTIMYVAFFACIGAAVYITGSAWCLWALLLAPSYSSEEGK